MWPWKSEPDYHAIALDEDDSDAEQSDNAQNSRARWIRTSWTICGLAFLLAVAIAITFALPSNRTGHHGAQTSDDTVNSKETQGSVSQKPHCTSRREWRTLSREEQQQYISAVLCLKSQSSSIAPGTNHTAYEDFPWLHSHVGYATHNSAPFLPWHRYFLHIYERTLKDKCRYPKDLGLVYWDWTLDTDALESSPVFDPMTGFGGDGEVGGEITVGRTGRCVVDGPFANTQVSFYDVKFQPHCLSRSFRDLDGNVGHMDGHDITPESIGDVLSVDSYETFVTLMESRVHDAIPFGIGGDFETFTAPYDPLFFLHHTQLDRLWWLWQQRQPNSGLESYGGHKERHSMDMASLDDVLNYRGLAPDVKVMDVMEIGSELLCYYYE